MSTRVRTVLFAVAFGLLATLGAAFYMNSLRAEIAESGTKYPVFVAKQNVSEGTPAADLLAKDLMEKVEVPKRYLATGAVGVLEDGDARVLAVPLGVGEQLTVNKFRSAEKSELAQRLDPGKIAIAVPVDEVVGVGGGLQSGDQVVIVATFEPGPGGSDISRILLKGIEVLAADGSDAAGAASRTTKKTITVAVTPTQAEKLVFAQEKGKVWIGLAAAGEPGLPATDGQTMEGIF